MKTGYLFLGISMFFLFGCAEDAKIKGLIEEANYCNSADECIVVQFDCPFGCNNIVNKDSNIEGIKKIITEYNTETAQMCVSDCLIPPKEFECINKKCIAKETKPNNDAECIAASDCLTGGCSNEICGKKGIVENMMTNCVYKEEYGCLRKTSCGCVASNCQWIENEEYIECLNSLK